MNEVIINTHLAGVRRFLASAHEEALAIGEIGLAARSTGVAMSHANKQSFLWRQSLFTLRRVIYAGTLVTLGAGFAAIKLGNDYNNAMQTATVALRPFLGTSQELTHVLDRLWTIAKFTPFQIKDMTLAFRTMYPAMRSTGVSADELVTTIYNLINALSVAGNTTPEALHRVSYALQHVAFQGRLTGRSVQQLASVGIPIFDILNTQLGITGDQLHNIAALGIPANVVLQAINNYISRTPGFMGAAQRQATMTVEGLWSTFKDNISQTMGLAEKQGFGTFQRLLMHINGWFNELQANQKRTNSFIKALDMTITPTSHTILNLWNRLTVAAKQLWQAFKLISAAILENKSLWAALGIMAWVLATAMGLIAHTMIVWRPVLAVVIPLLVAYRTWIIADAIATYIFTAALWAAEGAVGAYTASIWLLNSAIFAYVKWERIWMLLTTGFVRGADGRFVAMTRFEKVLLRLRVATLRMIGPLLAMDAAALANPYVLLAVAIVALIAGLTVLYFKWDRFHDLVDRTARWLYTHSLILGMVPVIGPLLFFAVNVYKIIHDWRGWLQGIVDYIRRHRTTFAMMAIAGPLGLAAGIIVEHLSNIWGGFKTLVHWIREAVRWMDRFSRTSMQIGPAKWTMPLSWLMRMNPITAPAAGLSDILGHIPGMARGGSVRRGGWSMVGEHGPELRYMPAGAVVQPLGHAAQPMTINLKAEFKVDGRKMAEVVARHQTSVNARR